MISVLVLVICLLSMSAIFLQVRRGTKLSEISHKITVLITPKYVILSASFFETISFYKKMNDKMDTCLLLMDNHDCPWMLLLIIYRHSLRDPRRDSLCESQIADLFYCISMLLTTLGMTHAFCLRLIIRR